MTGPAETAEPTSSHDSTASEGVPSQSLEAPDTPAAARPARSEGRGVGVHRRLDLDFGALTASINTADRACQMSGAIRAAEQVTKQLGAPQRRLLDAIASTWAPRRMDQMFGQVDVSSLRANWVSTVQAISDRGRADAYFSAVVADLLRPALYSVPPYDVSEAVRRMVDAQQLHLRSTGVALSRMLTLQAEEPLRSLLNSSLGRYGAASAALRDVSTMVSDLTAFPTMSTLAASGFNAHLDQLSTTPRGVEARFTAIAGNAASSLLTADSLWTSRTLDAAVEVAEGAYVMVVEPLLDPSSPFRIELRARLRQVNPNLADKRDYAWRIVSEDFGPVHSSVALHVTETLDQLLHQLAPIDAVISWLRDRGRKGEKWWFTKQGADDPQPTRASKAAYAMRHRGSVDEALVLGFEVALTGMLTCIVKEANAVKHGSSNATQRCMQSLLGACDSLLNLLLVDLES